MSNDVQRIVKVIMMSKFHLTCALLLSIAATILVGCDTRPPPIASEPMFKIDHYKFYNIKTGTTIAKVSVKLNDQFHEEKPLVAKVASPKFFGNPVIKTKNGEKKKGEKKQKFKNPMAHLTWYELETKSEPVRKLQLTNQFGKQTVTIGSPSFLLAPSLKSKKGKQIPRDMDLPNKVGHYVGYLIHNMVKPFGGSLKLKDQFITDLNATIGQAAYLFVPADKTVNGIDGKRFFKRIHATDHLVAFQLQNAKVQDNTNRQTRDQFNTLDINFKRPQYLAVPTKKKVLK